jgi:protein-disulfide isomerase
MTSGKESRRKRRVQTPPPVRSAGAGRTASPKVLLGAAVGIAGIVAAIVLVFAFTGGSSSPKKLSVLPDAGVVAGLFRGIPQNGTVLGSPKAPVTMIEYVDLQCPICRAFETDVMPSIIPRYVRTGKVKVEARTIAFIGPDSERGRRAALAAGQQNRFFNFAQLLYYNQGAENSGWLNDTMIRSAAASIPGVDSVALLAARNSHAVTAAVKLADDQATTDKVSGTPTIYVGKTGATPRVVSPGQAPDTATLSAALDAALR